MVTKLALQVLLHTLGTDGAFSAERPQPFSGMFGRHGTVQQVNGHRFFLAHLPELLEASRAAQDGRV